MKNLLNILSNELQVKLKDFKVSCVTIEGHELNIRSEYDMDLSFYNAIEKELIELGFYIEA